MLRESNILNASQLVSKLSDNSLFSRQSSQQQQQQQQREYRQFTGNRIDVIKNAILSDRIGSVSGRKSQPLNGTRYNPMNEKCTITYLNMSA
jgi:hypothetical protein